MGLGPVCVVAARRPGLRERPRADTGDVALRGLAGPEPRAEEGQDPALADCRSGKGSACESGVRTARSPQQDTGQRVSLP